MSSVSNAVGKFLYSATRKVSNAVANVGKSVTRRVKSLVNGNGKNGSATRKSQSAEKRASALKAASNKLRNFEASHRARNPATAQNVLRNAGRSLYNATRKVYSVASNRARGAVHSVGRAGKSLANGLRNRVDAARNASVAYSASLRRKQVSANRRAQKLDAIAEGNENNRNNRGSARRRADAAIMRGLPVPLSGLSYENQKNAMRRSEMPRRLE